MCVDIDVLQGCCRFCVGGLQGVDSVDVFVLSLDVGVLPDVAKSRYGW